MGPVIDLTLTSLFAGSLGIMLIILSVNVIRKRRAHMVAFGDKGDLDLKSRVRMHGNFVEYAPFAILLMGLSEVQGTPDWVLIALGTLFCFGRICHALGLRSSNIGLRTVGMMSTFAYLILMSVGLIAHSLI